MRFVQCSPANFTMKPTSVLSKGCKLQYCVVNNLRRISSIFSSFPCMNLVHQMRWHMDEASTALISIEIFKQDKWCFWRFDFADAQGQGPAWILYPGKIPVFVQSSGRTRRAPAFSTKTVVWSRNAYLQDMVFFENLHEQCWCKKCCLPDSFVSHEAFALQRSIAL